MDGANGSGGREVTQGERRSRISTLKDKLIQSDNDMARLEDHICGLLRSKRDVMNQGANRKHQSGAPKGTRKPVQAARHLSWGSPLCDRGEILSEQAVGSPWAVLQVPDEASLKHKLESSWSENERLRQEALADRLAMEDLRQKLVAASECDKGHSELQVKNMILENEVADLKEKIQILLAQNNHNGEQLSEERAKLQVEKLKMTSALDASKEKVKGLEIQVQALQSNNLGSEQLSEERAKLQVAKLKMMSELDAANEKVKGLEIQVQALQSSDKTSSTTNSGLVAEKKMFEQKLREAERKLEQTRERAEALQTQVDVSKWEIGDLRGKLVDAQNM